MRGLVISLYLGVFVALLGLGWGIDQYYSRTFDEEAEQPYSGYRAALQMAVAHLVKMNADEEIIHQYLSHQSLRFTLESIRAIPLPQSLKEQRDRGEIFMLQSERSVTLYQRIPDTDWLLNIEIETDDGQQNQTTRYLLTLLFYAGIAAILLLWLLPLLRGVQQLNYAARKIGEGELHTRVENPEGLYLKPLKTEFNAMAERLQQLNENNRLMSQAVSHELRTPLSRLRFALDLLEGREDQSQREQDMQRMESDLDDMEKLINELLNYARLDQQPTFNIEPINIESLLSQRIALRVEDDCNIQLKTANEDGVIPGDHDYLCKMIDNLIQNACRYASTKVLVNCQWMGSRFLFTVEDDGAGILPEHLTEIFKPFYRAKNQLVKKSGGFGLGLAIVKRIVNWHHGEITAGVSNSLGGAFFEISLPTGQAECNHKRE